MSDDDEEKRTINLIKIIVQNGKAVGTIFTIASMIVTGLWFAFDFYTKLDAMEKQFPIMQAQLTRCSNKIDSITRLQGWQQQRFAKIESKLNDDDTWIDDAYLYKMPYGKWGNK